jgi:glycine/D-amino acid oxidase-like deaminating enzyme
MSSFQFDDMIVGQGLAGTALAWSLRWRGRRVLVIDREARVTSSRIAAGLMTPITGQRLVKSWRWNAFWAAATAFYRRVEAEAGTRLFHPTRMVKLLANDREREFFDRRLASEFTGLVAQPEPLVNSNWFNAPWGGFEMIESGRLDVPAYLDVSRRRLISEGQYMAGDLLPNEDVALTSNGVELPRLGLRSDRIIFCQGIDAMSNHWFHGVRFRPAKGEILTLRIMGLAEERIIHRGVWLMALGGDLFRAGATYGWRQLDCEPTLEGREEICARLREFLKLPFDVVGHDAAVRPILLNQYPMLGLHPDHPQLGFFNGLGSKGALQAPWLAEHFAGFLAGEHPLDRELDLQRMMSLAK